MALAKELTNKSLPEIGRAFERDHTTVLNACREVPKFREKDSSIQEWLGEFNSHLILHKEPMMQFSISRENLLKTLTASLWRIEQSSEYSCIK